MLVFPQQELEDLHQPQPLEHHQADRHSLHRLLPRQVRHAQYGGQLPGDIQISLKKYFFKSTIYVPCFFILYFCTAR